MGANVGTETVSFSDIVGKSGRVHAFEPLPANISWLKQAKPIHNNITVHAMALGDFNGSAAFQVPREESSGTGYIRNGESTNTERVGVATLDSLSLDQASLVVVDIEGHEVTFLRGARNYLTKVRPAIVLEVAPKLLHRAGSSVDELKQLLSEYRYVSFAIGRFIAAKRSAQTGAANWLCLPTEREADISRVNRTLVASVLLPCIRGINPLARPNGHRIIPEC